MSSSRTWAARRTSSTASCPTEMSTDFEAQLRDVRASASRRRRTDTVLVILTLLSSATVLVPWLLGRFLLRDNALRPLSSTVYDTAIRTNGTYFLSDWLAGMCLLFVVLALFLILRPWSLRVGFVVVGFVALVVGAGVFGPVSAHLWNSDEGLSADRLETTAYPWSDTKFECDSESATFGGALWQAHTARTQGLAGGCDRVVIYRGWEPVGWAQLKSGQTEAGITIQRNGVVYVKDDAGKIIESFPLWKPPIQGESN